jgi:hypothetical protein
LADLWGKKTESSESHGANRRGVCHSLASRERIATKRERERIKGSVLVRVPGRTAGDQLTQGNVRGCDRRTQQEIPKKKLEEIT